MMVLDLVFDLWLVVVIFRPMLRAKQHNQLGIASKLVLLTLANLCFYLGVSGVLEHGIMWGLYSGLYVLLALVYSMARRVLPMFIERGVGYPVKLRNWAWIDRSAIYVFVLFLVADVFWRNVPVTAALAGLLFAAHALRLAGWYTGGIWNKPLLWVLYVGYGGATFGFLLKALAPFTSLPPSLALHAFALGGIGMITAGMMARISLGHTGRNIQQHSRLLAPAFAFLCAAYAARVAVADDRADALPAVAGHRAGGMDGRLCIARLGVCPDPGQTARRRDAGLIPARVTYIYRVKCRTWCHLCCPSTGLKPECTAHHTQLTLYAYENQTHCGYCWHLRLPHSMQPGYRATEPLEQQAQAALLSAKVLGRYSYRHIPLDDDLSVADIRQLPETAGWRQAVFPAGRHRSFRQCANQARRCDPQREPEHPVRHIQPVPAAHRGTLSSMRVRC